MGCLGANGCLCLFFFLPRGSLWPPDALSFLDLFLVVAVSLSADVPVDALAVATDVALLFAMAGC